MKQTMKQIWIKRALCTIIIGLLINPVRSQVRISDDPQKQQAERLSWWIHDRFGMFIHWGLYSLPARHEWVKKNEKLTTEQYQKYFKVFDPDLYNPKEWAKKAKNAGMKYAVITTKHHDGFCLFDSKYTDYKATNTPYGKDLIKEWVEAFRQEGLKIGFYYSLIDWHHPQFTIDKVHPQSPADEKQYEQLNQGRDMSQYRTYLFNQVRELLTQYGKIDILWCDFSYDGKHGKGKEAWQSVELLKMVRKLQPHILVNDRLGLADHEYGFDFITPEQFKVSTWPKRNGKKVAWETCQTFSGSWGYYRDEKTWKSIPQMLELLIETVSKGGNLILNVGPTARGEFDYRAKNALAQIGQWMKYHSRSVYGCTQAPESFKSPPNTLLTYNPTLHRLYIHLLTYPLQDLTLEGYADKITYAQFLHDASEIKISAPSGHWLREETEKIDINLKLPVNKPNTILPVIELFLKTEE